MKINFYFKSSIYLFFLSIYFFSCKSNNITDPQIVSMIYVCDEKGDLYAIDTNTGEEK